MAGDALVGKSTIILSRCKRFCSKQAEKGDGQNQALKNQKQPNFKAAKGGSID